VNLPSISEVTSLPSPTAGTVCCLHVLYSHAWQCNRPCTQQTLMCQKLRGYRGLATAKGQHMCSVHSTCPYGQPALAPQPLPLPAFLECICAYMLIHVWMHAHVCARVCVRAYVRVCTCTCLRARKRVRLCMDASACQLGPQQPPMRLMYKCQPMHSVKTIQGHI